MIHAALLLLMLEAVTGPRFIISLKRSTLKIQLSTSWAGRLSHLCTESDRDCAALQYVAIGHKLPYPLGTVWRDPLLS
jgi:hypothetical protein